MSKFVIKNIEAVKGKQQFKQLIILADDADAAKIQTQISKQEQDNKLIDEKKLIGEKVDPIKGQLDLYEDTLEAKYNSSFRRILMYMELVANLQSVPQKKFKLISPKKELVKEFEFKHEDLRVYAIDINNGKLIMYCGYKNQQKNDILKFRSLKEQYLASCEPKKITENEKRRLDKK